MKAYKNGAGILLRFYMSAMPQVRDAQHSNPEQACVIHPFHLGEIAAEYAAAAMDAVPGRSHQMVTRLLSDSSLQWTASV